MLTKKQFDGSKGELPANVFNRSQFSSVLKWRPLLWFLSERESFTWILLVAFHQPIFEKYAQVKLDHFPKDRGENKEL